MAELTSRDQDGLMPHAGAGHVRASLSFQGPHRRHHLPHLHYSALQDHPQESHVVSLLSPSLLRVVSSILFFCFETKPKQKGLNVYDFSDSIKFNFHV